MLRKTSRWNRGKQIGKLVARYVGILAEWALPIEREIMSRKKKRNDDMLLNFSAKTLKEKLLERGHVKVALEYIVPCNFQGSL